MSELEQIQMVCPICGGAVTKVKESSKPVKRNVVCDNEFYVHYIDHESNHVVIKLPEPDVSPDALRFSV